MPEPRTQQPPHPHPPIAVLAHFRERGKKNVRKGEPSRQIPDLWGGLGSKTVPKLRLCPGAPSPSSSPPLPGPTYPHRSAGIAAAGNRRAALRAPGRASAPSRRRRQEEREEKEGQGRDLLTLPLISTCSPRWCSAPRFPHKHEEGLPDRVQVLKLTSEFSGKEKDFRARGVTQMHPSLSRTG